MYDVIKYEKTVYWDSIIIQICSRLSRNATTCNIVKTVYELSMKQFMKVITKYNRHTLEMPDTQL